MRPASVADHVVPRAADPALRYDLANGQGLCSVHHNAKTAEEKSGKYRDTRRAFKG
jgi:5-methylcytosine-specific restriction endonuclease McrA